MVYEQTKAGIIVRVRLTPNSSSCSIRGVFKNAEGDGYLKITVTAVPEKGKANQALIAYLAKQLSLAKSRLEIVSGETDRCKKVLIKGENPDLIPQLNEWERAGEENE